VSLDAAVALRLGRLDLDVEIHVEPGELLAVLGPNGSGKSTLLRALAGLLPIDRGAVSIDGVTYDDPDRALFVPAEGRPIGVVFQDYLLFAHLSARENVAFGLRARGVPKDEARRRADEWLQLVGLADHASHRPRALSGGQAQRVALARALVTGPRLLLLDEPLGALDAGTRTALRRDLRRYLDSFDGMRVLVTHDPVDAYAFADRIAIVDSGKIVQVGTIGEVTAHPRSPYVAHLVGTNLYAGTVHGATLTTEGGAGIVLADAEPGPSFAVIRPQAITLSREAPVTTSARNVWQGVVGDVDRVGDRIRITVAGPLPLTAEITALALDTLDLRPGDKVFAAVKATDIDVYPA
jgi:molybdate transport system ATP-binding protein